MAMAWQEELRPGIALREIVAQATEALVAMNAERLEELARCCIDLNRDLKESEARMEATRQLQDAVADLKLLHRVLYETRANLTVLTRLHLIRVREASTARTDRQAGTFKRNREVFGVWDWRERKTDYGDN